MSPTRTSRRRRRRGPVRALVSCRSISWPPPPASASPLNNPNPSASTSPQKKLKTFLNSFFLHALISAQISIPLLVLGPWLVVGPKSSWSDWSNQQLVVQLPSVRSRPSLSLTQSNPRLLETFWSFCFWWKWTARPPRVSASLRRGHRL